MPAILSGAASIAQEYLGDFFKSKDEGDKIEKDTDKQYEQYYNKAKGGDVGDIPTEALQNMAMDPNCSDSARSNIAKELAKRGEPMDNGGGTAEERNAVYDKYYKMASDGDVGDIPTDILQRMANDPKCSSKAYAHIADELDKRGESVDSGTTEDSDRNARYEKYYQQAQAGDVGDIPTEALQDMANDPQCDGSAYGHIADELERRDEPIDPNDSDDTDDR